ncbi:ATP:cob(I)alamin adenosyltransferase [Glycomyces lechevalierae]|uniref:Corrinoid adenosyltransferase n=3 Tax=Glycomyces TaxID=58113 RepID=A0ABU2AUM6_9ACTN|nr:ATP:cob(I)alamin adenosyltransferase [Glycomyces lechevalierae]
MRDHVDPGEVGRGERAHRVAEAEPAGGVEVLGGDHAVLHEPGRLVHERADEAGGREPGDVAVDDHAGLPGGLGEAARGVERLVAGVDAAHELAELHHRHGREEVGAHDPLGMRCGGGDLRDRDGRGVRREDGLRRADARERAEDLLLDRETLEDRLDGDPRPRGLVEVGADGDARLRGLRVLRGDLLLGDEAVQRAADGGPCALERALVRVDQRDVPTAQARDLRDPGTHESRTDYRDFCHGARLYGRCMAVNLTRIYTKTGDDGTTGLADFSRVPKTHVRLAAYGDVDEANAVIGAALALQTGEIGEREREVLLAVQNDLFDVGADLSTPVSENPKYPPLRIDESYVTRLEGWIDEANADLEALRSFILRGGTPGAALLHQACTVARRAERNVWALLEAEPDTTHAVPVTYLNRLSDLLFVLARKANPGGDVLWKPRGSQA